MTYDAILNALQSGTACMLKMLYAIKQGGYIDDVIEKVNAVVFTPDTLDEANHQGYENCERCIRKKTFRLGVELRIEE